MKGNKIPIFKQPDNVIKQIREFRRLEKELRIHRAKGYCEICHKPLGTQSLELKAHHIIKPSEYTIRTTLHDPNIPDNLVICCDYCYQRHVLTNRFRFKSEYTIPNTIADESIKRKKEEIKLKIGIENLCQIKYSIKRFIGIKLNTKWINLKIGIEWQSKKRIKRSLNEN
jgi:hypothetical protein